MPITAQEIQEVLALLEATPVRIAESTAGLDEAQLRWRPDKQAWSALQILSHLRACDAVWTYSIHAMLILDEPTLAKIHPRDWDKKLRYKDGPFANSLTALDAQRADLLRILRKLPPEDWERGAIIDRHRHTVFTQARRLAFHETQHCDQIAEVVAQLAGE